MKKNSDNIVKLMRLLSEPARLDILSTLYEARNELAVSHIQSETGHAQSLVSRHLGYMKRAHLLNVRPLGKQRFYSINFSNRELAAILPLLKLMST